MKRYTRSNLQIYEPHTSQPSESLFPFKDADYWQYFRFHLKSVFAWSWYGYVVLGFVIGFSVLFAEWYIIVAFVAFLLIIYLLTALYAARVFSKLADNNVILCFNQNGVNYVVKHNDDNSAESDFEVLLTSPWADLNEIRFFDRFMLLKFVPTSKMRILIVPTVNLKDNHSYQDNILCFWKQYASSWRYNHTSLSLFYCFLHKMKMSVKLINIIVCLINETTFSNSQLPKTIILYIIQNINNNL